MYIKNSKGIFYVNTPENVELNQVILHDGYYYPNTYTDEYGISYTNENGYQITDKELAEAFKVENVEMEIGDNFNDITKEYHDSGISDMKDIYDGSSGSVVISEDPLIDNFLTTGIKRVLNEKRMPLTAFTDRVDKIHDLNNMNKSLVTGNITNKRFETLTDILDLEYCLILQDKEGARNPMGKPVVAFSAGFDFEKDDIFTNDAIDMVNKFRGLENNNNENEGEDE